MMTDKVLDFIKNAKVSDWERWIQNIVRHNLAYPLSDLSANGDVLTEVIKLMRRTGVSVFNYEVALSKSFEKEYRQNVNNFTLQERYLMGLIQLSASSCKGVLIDVVYSRINFKSKGKFSYVKTLALLCLSRCPVLNEEESRDLFSYIQSHGLYEMRHDNYFYSTSLRFVYRQISINSFFVLLQQIVVLREESMDDIDDVFLHLILDKIDELIFKKPGVINKYLVDWVKVYSENDKFNFDQKSFGFNLLSKVGDLYLDEDFNIDLKNGQSAKSLNFLRLIKFYLSLILKRDISGEENLLNDAYKLIDLLLFVAEDRGEINFEINLIEHNVSYVKECTALKILPTVMEEECEYTDVVRKVHMALDGVIHNPLNPRISKDYRIKALKLSN